MNYKKTISKVYGIFFIFIFMGMVSACGSRKTDTESYEATNKIVTEEIKEEEKEELKEEVLNQKVDVVEKVEINKDLELANQFINNQIKELESHSEKYFEEMVVILKSTGELNPLFGCSGK